MGWSSWNAFYCGIDEDLIRSNVELMDSMGLKDLGYDYVRLERHTSTPPNTRLLLILLRLILTTAGC